MNVNDLFEMSNFSSKTTGLPSNIIVWCRTDLLNHGHNKYRVKITKDRLCLAIFTVGDQPRMVKNINNSLSDSEESIITDWIKSYSSLIIGLIDGKLDTAEFSYEIQKIRNMKNNE